MELQHVSGGFRCGCFDYKAGSLTGGCETGEMSVSFGIPHAFFPLSASDMSKWGWRRETAFPLLFLLSECWGWVIWCLDEWFLPGYNLLTYYYNFGVCRVREKASLFHKEELKCVFRLNVFEIPLLPQEESWLGKQNFKGMTRQLGQAPGVAQLI